MAKFKPLPTIKVKADNELGYMFINEADFEESEHERFEEVTNEPKADPKKETNMKAARRVGIRSEDSEEDQK